MATQAQTSAPKKGAKGKQPPKTPPKGTHVLPGAAKLIGGEKEIPPEQRQAERRQDDNDRRQTDADANNAAFAASQVIGAPVAGGANLAEFNAKVQALAEEMGVDATKVSIVPMGATATKVAQNGITRPKADTICGRIWHAADQITVNTKAPATIAELKMVQELRQVNDHTMKTQYARWRQFNGVKGRIEKVTQAQVSGVVMTHEGNP